MATKLATQTATQLALNEHKIVPIPREGEESCFRQPARAVARPWSPRSLIQFANVIKCCYLDRGRDLDGAPVELRDAIGRVLKQFAEIVRTATNRFHSIYDTPDAAVDATVLTDYIERFLGDADCKLIDNADVDIESNVWQLYHGQNPDQKWITVVDILADTSITRTVARTLRRCINMRVGKRLDEISMNVDRCLSDADIECSAARYARELFSRKLGNILKMAGIPVTAVASLAISFLGEFDLEDMAIESARRRHRTQLTCDTLAAIADIQETNRSDIVAVLGFRTYMREVEAKIASAEEDANLDESADNPFDDDYQPDKYQQMCDRLRDIRARAGDLLDELEGREAAWKLRVQRWYTDVNAAGADPESLIESQRRAWHTSLAPQIAKLTPCR
jgi:hypothetical protein